MQQTANYNLLIPEGTDIVNPLTQVNPNFQTIDSAMFANKQATIGTASEVVTGSVHAIIRNNPDSGVFRFTATGAWTAGDTMTLDGQQVTVHLSDGTTPATNSYIIGAEVLAMVNGTLVTLAISTTPPAQGVTSFNSRTGAVVPTASDYDASMVDYDNTLSGLNATDVQGAIDEIAAAPSGNNYSQTEHVVGKWIDGTTDVYEKTVISTTALPNNSRIDIPLSISNLGRIVDIMILSYSSVQTTTIATPYNDNTNNIYWLLRNNTSTLTIGTNTSVFTDFDYHVINLRYTKSV